MKQMLIALFVALVLLHGQIAFGQPEINGEYSTLEGLPVLVVWGTEYEMGYAQGVLIGDEIVDLYDDFVVPLVFESAGFYNLATEFFDALYEVPEHFRLEAQGIIDGAQDAGHDIFIPFLGRDLAPLDILTAGSMADIIGFFSCSSLIAWGDATSEDPELLGETALVRNLDWYALPSDPTVLARKTIIVGRKPEYKNATISISFPGFLGCLSCMNDQGVSALQHQSHPGILFFNKDYTNKFMPINLAMREGLETSTPVSSVEETASIIESFPRSSSSNIVCAGPNFQDDPPLILETSNKGSARRFDVDDPDFPFQTLGVTNHQRKLRHGYPCKRYRKIRENVNDWEGQITLARLWQNNLDVVMTPFADIIGTLTAQTMIFIPEKRRIGLAYSDDFFLAPEKQPTWFLWEDVFTQTADDDDDDDESPSPQDPDESDDDDTENDDEGCCG